MKNRDNRGAGRAEKGQQKCDAASATKRTTAAGWVWEWTKSILIALVLFLVIRTFVVEAFRIPTGSMENTLLVGDFLLVNKAVYGAQVPATGLSMPAFGQPERGDVVVFVPPHGVNKNYVKRLVGVPGDTLEMRQKVLYVNGQEMEEPYVQHTDPLTDHISVPEMLWQREYLAPGVEGGSYRPTRDTWGPLVVPESRFFMLGDNRDDSEDSRYWGFVDQAAIRGQPLFVYFSYDAQTMRPFAWLTEVRLGRIGTGIR